MPSIPSHWGSEAGIGAEPHQGGGDGRAGQTGELAQRVTGARPRVDHPTAGVEDRPARGGDQFHRFAHLGGIAVGAGLIAVGEPHGLGRRVGAFGELHVLGDVDQHRPGPARGGDVEGLVQDAGEVAHVLDQDVVLGGRAGDPDRVAFLEGVGADQVGGHLAGDHH